MNIKKMQLKKVLQVIYLKANGINSSIDQLVNTTIN